MRSRTRTTTSGIRHSSFSLDARRGSWTTTRGHVSLSSSTRPTRARGGRFSRRASLLATRPPRRDDDPHGFLRRPRAPRSAVRASPRASVPRRPRPRRPIGAAARGCPPSPSRPPPSRAPPPTRCPATPVRAWPPPATPVAARPSSPPPSPSPPRPSPPTPPPRPTSTGATSGTPSRSRRICPTTTPMTFTLLGEPLVFWRDHTANAPDGTPTWRCTADKCPHRLVPLSRDG